MQAVKSISSISTLPEITTRVIKTVEDPKSDAKQLHAIVSHDPALVTRILKVVNSAFYGLPGQVASIDRAIVILGLTAVKNLAVAASLGQMFRGVRLCDGYNARDLWTHCVSVAVVSRELSRTLKLPLAEEAFLAGMIHDVGLLVSLQCWPEKLSIVCEQAKQGLKPFCEIEREVMGVDHQMLGKALAERWQFPRTCLEAAGFHHEPQLLAADARALTSVVYVADRLCCDAKAGFWLTGNIETPIDYDSIKLSGIDEAVVNGLREQLPKILESAAAFMG